MAEPVSEAKCPFTPQEFPIQDVRVQANTYDARRVGLVGVFNTHLRSGSYAIHGSVVGETRQGSWLASASDCEASDEPDILSG